MYRDIEKRAKEILSEMTLKAKIGQVTQINFMGNNVDEVAEKIREYGIGSVILSNSQFAGFVEQESVKLDRMTYFQKLSTEESPNGIPLLIGRDVIHGHNIIFPINLGMAASFDPELIKSVYECIRAEAADDGINWTYSPMLDFCHDPRWGRIVEGQGEDPYLASKMAAAIVRGFQGDDLSTEGVLAACAKHYVGYGASEGGRDYNHTEISDYALQNNYLPAFRGAVNAGVATVMNSFNEINGVPVAASRKALTDILRGQLGFEGFVISDWASIAQLKNHGLAQDNKEAASLAIKAGIDMDMVDNCYFDYMEELVNEGTVSLNELDTAVLRILKIKLKMGLFERPYQKHTEINLEEHAAKAKQACESSFVLLKNSNSLLPLKANTNICIAGPFADLIEEHTGSWALEKGGIEIKSFRAAVTAVAGEKAIIEDFDGLSQHYLIPRNSDVVICALGEPRRVTGEAQSLTSIEISNEQKALLKHLKRSGKPIVGVMFYGRPTALQEVEPYLDAIIYCWHSGSMSTVAAADVIYGKSEPTGRLPVTLPRVTGQIPLYYNALPGARHMNGYYGESGHDILNYNDCEGTPLYPFGYGLSYTGFQYSSVKAECDKLSLEDIKSGASFNISVGVKNTGALDGTEVVQLYIRDSIASRVRPLRELKGFKKLKIKAGEEVRVCFEIGYDELGFYLENGEYTVEKGKFEVFVVSNCLTDNKLEISIL